MQEVSELMKLHIQGVQQNAHKFIKQLLENQFRFVRKVVDWGLVNI